VRRGGWILGLFVLSSLPWWAYEASRLPPGLESKGETSDVISWLSLAGSIVSLVTGVVTLTLEIIKLKQSRVRGTSGDS
jgi:cytosine/uracil/thiamine/allantoin permease